MKKLIFFVLLLLNYQSPILAKCIKGDCKNGPGIYDDSKGNKYIGNFKDGDRHGEGSMTWDVGDTYKGQWVKNKMHGKGTYYRNKHFTYTGSFKAGIIEGQGTAKYTNGVTYTGEWKNNTRHGQGTLVDNKGNKFTGQFINGKQGQGVVTKAKTKAQTKVKTKGCVTGNCKNGSGKLRYKNGDVYEGNFKDTYRHGKGSYAWKSGGKFVGEWIKDDGVKGTYEYKNGNIYTGDFKKNSDLVRHGFGKFVTKSTGEIRNGLWCNNKYIGNDPGFTVDTCIKVAEGQRKARARKAEADSKEFWSNFNREKKETYEMMSRARKCYYSNIKQKKNQGSGLWYSALESFNNGKKFENSSPGTAKGLFTSTRNSARAFLDINCK